MSSAAESTPAPAPPKEQSEQPSTSSPGSSSSGSVSRGVPVSSALKGLSYKEASAKLSPSSSSAMSIAESAFSGGGSAPNSSIASAVQQTTGVDVSGARHHTGPAAAEACSTLGAEAFTVGSNVAFASASPSAHTVAHEYAHVAQQSGGSPSVMGKGASGLAPVGNLEAQADAVADAVVSGGAKTSVSSAPVSAAPKVIAFKKRSEQQWMEELHKPELKSIIRYLKGTTRDSDVTKVCKIFKNWDIPMIQAAWLEIRRMDPDDNWFADFIDNFGLDHMRAYPREIYATIALAGDKWRWKKLIDLTSTGFLNGVSREEAFYAFLILQSLPESWQTEFNTKHSKHAKELGNNLDKDAYAKFRAAMDPKKEKQRRDHEKDKREAKVKDEHRLAELHRLKKDLTSGELKKRIDSVLKLLKGNWIGYLTKDLCGKILDVLVKTLKDDPSGAGVRAIAFRMEQTDDVDTWCRRVDKGRKYNKGEDMRAFLHVLKARPPAKALEFCRELMSVGWFHGVDEDEARLAYELIRLQPLSVQKEFRESKNGVWLERMETHLSKEVVKDKDQTTLGADGQLVSGTFGTAGSKREKAELAAADKALKDKAWGVFEELFDLLSKKVDRAAADKAFTKLKVLDGQVRLAMVRRLDAIGGIEKIFEQLGKDAWKEDKAPTSMAILGARDPMRAIAHMQRLVSDGRFWIDLVLTNVTVWGAMSKDEARYAYALFKSLPPKYREKVRADNPTWWGWIVAEMGDQANQDLSLNMYNGGKDQKDRMSILGQLVDKTLWECAKGSPEGMGRLENVIRMAAAAGHRKLIYDTAKTHTLADFQKVLEANRIVDKTGAFLEKAPPNAIEKNNWGAFKGGMDLAWDGDVKGFNLEDLGAAAGAQFNKVSADDAAKGINRIDIGINTQTGTVAISSAGVDLKAIHTTFGDTALHTGPLTTGAFSINATFPTPDNPKQETTFKVHLEKLDVSDVLAVNPGSQVAVQKITLESLDLSGHEIPAIIQQGEKDKKKATQAALPTRSLLLTVWDGIGRWMMGKQQIDPASDFGADGPAMAGPGGTQIKAKGLVVKGLSTSGGAHVDKIEIKGEISLSIDRMPSVGMEKRAKQLQGRVAKAKARIKELTAKSDKTEVETHELERLQKEVAAYEAEITKIEKDLPKLKAEDARYVELYKKQRGGKPLVGEEAKEYERLHNARKGKSYVTADVGTISMTGVGMSAGDHKGSVTIDGISASGQSNMMGLGFVGNPAMAATMAGGGRPDVKAPLSASGDVAIGKVTADNITLPGSVPDYTSQKKLRDKLSKLKPDAMTAEQRRQLIQLNWLWGEKEVSVGTETTTYGKAVEELVAQEKGGLEKINLDAAMLQRRQALLNAIRGTPTEVKHIEMSGIKLTAKSMHSDSDTQSADDVLPGADPDSSGRVAGQFGMSIGEVSATGIKSGGQEIKGATVLGVQGDASLSYAWSNDSHTGAMDGTLSAERIKLEGINTGPGGATVKEVDVHGAKISASTAGDGTVTISADKLTASGITVPSMQAKIKAELDALYARDPQTQLIRAQIADLEQKKADFEAWKKDLDEKGKELKQKKKTLKKTRKKADKKALEKEIWVIEQRIAELKTKIEKFTTTTKVDKDGSNKPDVTLTGASVTATGVGNFLDSNWDPAKTADGKPRTIGIKVHLDTADINNVLMQSPTTKLKLGTAKVPSGFDATVDVRIDEKKDETTGQPGYSFVPTFLKVLDVPQLGVKGLYYAMPVDGELLEINVPSADLTGVHAHGLPLDFKKSDMATLAGSFSIDKGKADIQANIGTYFKAGGKVVIGKKLSLDMFKSGDVNFDPGNLSLKNFGFQADGSTPKGSMVEKLRGLGGNVSVSGLKTKVGVNRVDGKMTVTGPIGSLGVSNLAYKAKGHDLVLKQGSVEGVWVDAFVQLDPEYLKAQFAGTYTDKVAVKSWHLKTLKVKKVSGSGLHYKNPEKKIDIALKSGYAKDIEATNFRSNSKAFQLKVGKQPGDGKDKDKSIHFEGLNIVQGAMEINTTGDVDGLDVSTVSDGTITTNVRGIKTATDITEGGKKVAHVDVGGKTGADLGITINPNGLIGIGAKVPNVTVKDVDYSGTTAAGKPWSFKVTGSAQLHNVNANLDIYMPPGTEKTARTIRIVAGPDAARPLLVPKTTMKGVQIMYDGLKIDINDGVANGLHMTQMEFLINQSAPNAKGERKTTGWNMSGNAGFADANLTDAGVVVPGLLSGGGKLKCGKLDLNFLEKDNLKFDLDWMRLNKGNATLNKVWRVANVGAGADNVHVRGRKPGEKGISGSYSPTMTSIKVGKATGDLDVNKTGGRLEGTKAGPSTGQFNIDLGVLDKLQTDLVILLPGGMPIPLIIRNGRFFADFSKVSKALKSGWFDWMDLDLSTKLARMVGTKIADWLDEKLRLKPKVEKWLEDTLSGKSVDADPVNFQQMLTGMLKDSLLKSIAVDALLKGGKGVIGTAGEEAEQWVFKQFDKVTGWDVAKHNRERITEERARTLRKWISQIGLLGAVTANGGFEGQWVPADGSAATNFLGGVSLKLALWGKLDPGISAKFDANVRGLKVINGGTTVTVEKVDLSTSIDAKDKKSKYGGTLSGKAKTTFNVEGVEYTKLTPKAAAPADDDDDSSG